VCVFLEGGELGDGGDFCFVEVFCSGVELGKGLIRYLVWCSMRSMVMLCYGGRGGGAEGSEGGIGEMAAGKGTNAPRVL
jgi:hypothetical protein